MCIEVSTLNIDGLEEKSPVISNDQYSRVKTLIFNIMVKDIFITLYVSVVWFSPTV